MGATIHREPERAQPIIQAAQGIPSDMRPGVLRVGPFTIRHLPHNPGRIWIQEDGGEGGEFCALEFAEHISLFFMERF
jgi:hypothetical protein